ncbi:MAG TPA: NifB/NifX family molybdenum-iron cluster-binding protein [Anaerolineales bacterium]|nr:NifB/NifX family molybdenum-iron cluster-binding protein [Anaerolineales bacterium]
MKIAAITDDGKTISQHFGRAPHYAVVTVEDGKVINFELRDKWAHAQFQAEEKSDEHHAADMGPHGYGPDAEDRHNRMADAIDDCQALLCRGMGMGAFESMKSRNILPIVTDIVRIDEAVNAYVRGQIINHMEKLH